ncbi:MAG: hypothetical protein LLF98_08120 [Clostridium sp.]|uniref:hypothetical protein n=1 Tax=Clostridium sp. TaxID=1506 RepID=UPI0025C39A0A|nr:hypothetical protein [Clostridium sp.]MCE5221220.1 hypothetical protein [Clostridium sp.]
MNVNGRVYSLNQITDKYIILESLKISSNYIDKCKEYEYRYVCKDFKPMHLEINNKYFKGILCIYDWYLGLEWEYWQL